MDKLILRLANVKRLHAYPLKVNNIGYIPDNYHCRKWFPNSIDFGFELSGKSEKAILTANGKKYEANYPCVTAIMPSVHYEMLTEKPWEVLYFSYASDLQEVFKQFNIDVSRSIWNFQMTPRISSFIKMIFDLCHNIHEFGAIDMLDRLCEQLISATIVNSQSNIKTTDPIELAVRQIASYIELHYLKDLSLGKLVSNYNISQSSFLRVWTQIFSIPPSRYITKMKIAEASHLLTDTSMRIKEVAAFLNFDDPLYFSRKFKKETGFSPNEYRHLDSVRKSR
jgi:AraC family transcriptional regulator, arabinose operon regulatory protein